MANAPIPIAIGETPVVLNNMSEEMIYFDPEKYYNTQPEEEPADLDEDFKYESFLDQLLFDNF